VPSETTLVASLRNERLASSAISEPRKSPKSVAFGESAEVEALRATTSAPSIKIEALPLGFDSRQAPRKRTDTGFTPLKRTDTGLTDFSTQIVFPD
jgi:hypothetical protein